MESEYTALPFLSYSLSIKLFIAAIFSLFAVILVKVIISKHSLSLHRAPFSIIFAYICASLANITFCTFLYWYWAAGLSLLMSVIYAFTTAREVKEANSEERMGVWGLNKDIRKVRGELFNDMTIEDQLAYSAKIKETEFSKLIFIIITLIVPAIFIFVLSLLDIGYLFFPVLIETL